MTLTLHEMSDLYTGEEGGGVLTVMGLAWYSGLDRYVPPFRVWFLRDSWPYGVVFVV